MAFCFLLHLRFLPRRLVIEQDAQIFHDLIKNPDMKVEDLVGFVTFCMISFVALIMSVFASLSASYSQRHSRRN